MRFDERKDEGREGPAPPTATLGGVAPHLPGLDPDSVYVVTGNNFLNFINSLLRLLSRFKSINRHKECTFIG